MTFGATDAPLTGEDLEKYGLVQFPMVMGGIVPVVNLEGIKPGELVLDGPTLAKIFLGEIKTWDDAGDRRSSTPAPSCRRRRSSSCIARTGRARPSTSPTTWPRSARTGSRRSASTRRCEWPVGIGAKGNEGVANNVAQTKGSIGYVEYAYAKQNKLTYTKMINKDGKTVAPTSDSVPGRRRQCRLEFAARLRRDPHQPARRPVLADDGRDLDPDVQAAGRTPPRTAEALKFFAWAYAKGDKMAEELDYVPMPDNVVDRHQEDVGGRDQGRAAASRCSPTN